MHPHTSQPAHHHTADRRLRDHARRSGSRSRRRPIGPLPAYPGCDSSADPLIPTARGLPRWGPGVPVVAVRRGFAARREPDHERKRAERAPSWADPGEDAHLVLESGPPWDQRL